MKINERQIVAKAYAFAQEYHTGEASGHDFEHIKRVYANVKALLKQAVNTDSFIVEMSALLHDVDDRKLNTDGNNTRRFLESIHLDDEQINTIINTIEAIGYSKTGDKPQLETIEMRLLFDADKLDAMGAIGICRVLAFSSKIQRPLFDEAFFPKQEMTSAEYMDMKRKDTTVNHFFDKLLKLKKAMQTEEGKAEAEKRHRFMVDFLKEFFREQNQAEWIKFLEDFEAK